MCLFFLSYRPRSRGKTAVEDEDSMDGLETTETETIVETGIKTQEFIRMYMILCICLCTACSICITIFCIKHLFLY